MASQAKPHGGEGDGGVEAGGPGQAVLEGGLGGALEGGVGVVAGRQAVGEAGGGQSELDDSHGEQGQGQPRGLVPLDPPGKDEKSPDQHEHKPQVEGVVGRQAVGHAHGAGRQRYQDKQRQEKKDYPVSGGGRHGHGSSVIPLSQVQPRQL